MVRGRVSQLPAHSTGIIHMHQIPFSQTCPQLLCARPSFSVFGVVEIRIRVVALHPNLLSQLLRALHLGGILEDGRLVDDSIDAREVLFLCTISPA